MTQDFCTINTAPSGDGRQTAIITTPCFGDRHFRDVGDATAMLFGGDGNRVVVDCFKTAANDIRVSVECPDYAWQLATTQIKDAVNRVTTRHNSPLHRFLGDLGTVVDTAQRMAGDAMTMFGDVKSNLEKAKTKPRIES